MKAKFVRDDAECIVKPPDPDQTHFVEKMRNGRIRPICFWNKGAVVTFPRAYHLVQCGICEPADAECEEAADMTPEMMEAAQKAHVRLKRGIHHTDNERYERGELVGYNPDGSDIPGPNAATFDDDEDDDDEEDDNEEE